jgi:hypothetical protein
MNKHSDHGIKGQGRKVPSIEALGTGTDPRVGDWAISDAVIRLRQAGTDRKFEFPTVSELVSQAHGAAATAATGAAHEGLLVGASPKCDIHVEDPQRRISRNHAFLFHRTDRWHLLDLGSKNGMMVDGVKQYAACLAPGMEIQIGGVTLIAESLRSIDLRCFLGRVLGWGWGDDADKAVDRAMQSIRGALLRSVPICLQGEGDLAPVAMELHRLLFGAANPFVMCDPRRQTRDGDARSASNVEDLAEAFAAARGGSLCVRGERLPDGLAELVEKVRDARDRPESTVQIIVCDDGSSRGRIAYADPIAIPPLHSRSTRQLERVVHEYLAEAVTMLGAAKMPPNEDRDWILRYSAASLAEVSKGAMRLVALRKEGSVAGAARALGMAAASLRKWLGNRGVPPCFSAAEAMTLGREGDGDEPDDDSELDS